VLLAAGESVVAVAERLGHDNASLVLSTYGHLLPDQEERNRTAIRLLGYAPVSPDGAEYRYDARTDEVSNKRHGSYRHEQLHSGLDADSSLLDLLHQLKAVRTDLRFREDGIHTTLTLERPSKEK